MASGAELITSPSNPTVKRARALRRRRDREREGAFLVEGIHPVWEAVAHRARIEALLVAPELLDSEPARQLVEEQRDRGVSVVHLGRRAFQSLSERDDPTGLAAIVRTRPGSLEALRVEPTSVFVALEEVSSPGNLGTIVRTADAVGASGVVVAGPAADPYDPRAVRASMGSLFSVPVVDAADLRVAISWARERGVGVVTTSAHASTEHWRVEYRLPVMVVLGSEARGLDAGVLSAGDSVVCIPMWGCASSLNLAVAAGILLYEIRRQATPPATATSPAQR